MQVIFLRKYSSELCCNFCTATHLSGFWLVMSPTYGLNAITPMEQIKRSKCMMTQIKAGVGSVTHSLQACPAPMLL